MGGKRAYTKAQVEGVLKAARLATEKAKAKAKEGEGRRAWIIVAAGD